MIIQTQSELDKEKSFALRILILNMSRETPLKNWLWNHLRLLKLLHKGSVVYSPMFYFDYETPSTIFIFDNLLFSIHKFSSSLGKVRVCYLYLTRGYFLSVQFLELLILKT